MKQTTYAPNVVPTAGIAVNKSRLKVYKNVGNLPTYYLQKAQEFQIELFNPTTDVVMAKIILNGKAISQGGLVLNPGQRIFLDRYLDVAKKFLFDTYEVANTAEVKKAIEDNGDFKVEFYRERQPYFNQYNGIITTTNYHPQSITLGNYHCGTHPDFLRGSGTINGLIGGTTTGTFLNASNTQNASYTSSVGPTLDSLSLGDTKSIPEHSKLKRSRLSKESIETGRVEMGSSSEQKIKTVNKSFEYSAFHSIEYKMLPISQKINTSEDINVKVYCVNCGAKLAKTDRFCGQCGCKK